MTADTRRHVFGPHLVSGLLLIVIGIALMLDRLGIMEAWHVFRFWPLAIVLYGAGYVVEATTGGSGVENHWRGRSGFRVFAFIFLVAVLPTLIVQGRIRRREARAGDTASVQLSTFMGRGQTTSTASPFQSGRVNTMMGESRLDLTQAKIAPGETADLEVGAVMGGVVVTVPNSWAVDVEAVPVMGEVKDERGQRAGPPAAGESAPPHLVIRGFIMMGELTIRSEQ